MFQLLFLYSNCIGMHRVMIVINFFPRNRQMEGHLLFDCCPSVCLSNQSVLKEATCTKPIIVEKLCTMNSLCISLKRSLIYVTFLCSPIDNNR